MKALIIEDAPDRALLHRMALEDRGMDALIASTVAEGIKLLKNFPAFDLVISDLNFDPNSSDNVDGEGIGRWIERNDYPTVSVLCSAKVFEVNPKYLQASKLFHEKLPSEGGEEQYNRVVELAKIKAEKRISSSRLQVEDKISHLNQYKLLQVHTLSSSNPQISTDYFDKGYEIVVIQPYFEDFPIGNPFFVWVKAAKDGFVMEVYKNPGLLSFAESFESALEVLNEVMISHHEELKGVELGGQLLVLKKFLDTIYEKELVANDTKTLKDVLASGTK